MKTFSFFALLMVSHAWAYDIEVKLQDFSSEKGNILYLLFDQEKGFPDAEKKAIKKDTIPAKEALKNFVITDVPNGHYALSLFHDKNMNEKLDTNFIGMPKEAFGFSNNPRIYFGPPSFKKASFPVKNNVKVEIEMKEM